MKNILTILIIFFISKVAFSQDDKLPIIDMHMHAIPANSFGENREFCPGDIWKTFPGIDPTININVRELENCPNPLIAPKSDDELISKSMEIINRRNIIGVLGGDLEFVKKWTDQNKDRFIPALPFADPSSLDLNEIRKLIEEDKIKILGEIWTQNIGLSPSGPELNPVLNFAQEMDVPVAIHMGPGVPGGIHFQGDPDYSLKFNNPLELEEALRKYPKLRVYVMHAGYPMISEMILLLYAFPQVYVDIAVINWYHPKEHFHKYLKELVDAGFGKRIMFGSDFVVWPEAMEIAIESIQTADFLTEQQKRDILYNNAAIFLRLSEEEIQKHHGK